MIERDSECRYYRDKCRLLEKKVEELESVIIKEKKIEEKLRRLYCRFEAVMDSLDAFVFVTHFETYEILFANKLTRENFGIKIGTICWESFKENANGPCSFCKSIKLLENNGIPNGVHVHRIKNIKDNEWYELHIQAIPWVDGSIVRLEIASNITKQIQYEKERLKSKNIESLGILAGGIAHDFNNLLAIILGNISLVKIASPADSRIQKYLDRIETAISQARELTNHLLTFSKGGIPVFRTVSIPKIIKNIAGLTLSGSNVKCHYEFDNNLYPVSIDETQISIAFRNILANSVDAMPGGGYITIKGKNTHCPLFLVTGDPTCNHYDKFIQITFEDKGIGINEDHLKNIFDPFFTTKLYGSGKGKGLGLPIAYSIIKKHNGFIEVTSQPGNGTNVEIYLPAFVEIKEEKAVPINQTVNIEPIMTRRILVMDDEPFIREMFIQMIQELGFDCCTASDGDEAIMHYLNALNERNPFDIVILDLTIKNGMGGKKTIEKILEINPSVFAVVSSGYAYDEVIENFKEYGFKAILPKPFSIDQLKEIIAVG